MTEKRKQRLSLAILITMCVPFFFWVKIPEQWTVDTSTLYIGLITGFIGTVFLLWQFTLGSRSVSATVFQDLAWPLRLHKFLGKWGTLLIFVHPVMIFLAYGENLFYVIKLNFSTNFETAVSWGRIGLIALLVIWLTSAFLRGKIKYRPWKYIHYLSYIILPFVFLHSPPIGTSLGDSTVLLGYWYGLTMIYIVLVAMRLRHVFGFDKFEYEVVENKALNNEVQLLRMRPLAKKITTKRGQYVYLQPSFLSEEHPFTVLDSNPKTGEVLVAYKIFGSFTRKMKSVTSGSRVFVDGPYGVFTREIQDQMTTENAVFIAGGIGITPFLSHVYGAGQGQEPTLFYANRTVQSAVFRDELRSRLNSKYVDIFSQEKVAGSQNIEHGYISEELIKKYLDDPLNCRYFICGPRGMIGAAKQALLFIGVPKSRIHSEEFSF